MQKALNVHMKYDLIVDGGLFYGTTDDRKFAEEHAKRIGGWVRDYAVSILRYNPHDRRDVEWKKGKGLSVWANPEKPPFDPVAERVAQSLLQVTNKFEKVFGYRPGHGLD